MVNPIFLGQAGTRIGLAQALAQQPPVTTQRRVVGDDPKAAPQYGASARNYGLAEALQPISVESGTWAEAIAEALAGGLRGRAAQSERQQAVDTEQWDRNQAEKTQGARNSAISEALAGFDPANPQGMVGALSQGAPEEALGLATALAGRESPEMWSEPFEMNNMQVQRSSASNQIRPIGNPPAAMIYQPPAGYRGTPETGLEAIPGGPADIRATAEGRSRAQQMDSSIRQLDNAITVIGEALPNVDWNSTGLVGQTTRGIGGTDAYNLNQQLEPVRAILSFENLAEMRRNSATGGALGSIAVRELELLGNTVRSLDTAQGTEQVRNALNATRGQFQRTLAALQAARQELEQGPSDAPMEPMAPEQQQERVLQWSPERGVY